MPKLVPVIMAGGVGSRLWPLSREQYPKQFIPLVDDRQSLLQLTLSRIQGLADLSESILLCNEEHRFLVAEQLRQLNAEGASIVLEPEPKNTAPAVALAAHAALAEADDAVLLVLPADHLIPDVAAFQAAVKEGLVAAANGQLVTFGVTPTRAETGYGYIKRDGPSESAGYVVERFVEKPDQATAQGYLASGDYFWNSGMFMFSASTYLQELQAHAADIHAVCEEAYRGASRDMDFSRVPAATFTQCRSDSIDYAVMEHTRNAVVIPLSLEWSDVGAWDAVADAAEADGAGNVVVGDVALEQVENSYIRAESRLVAGIGLDNTIVVETPDVVLVADKSRAQDVKKVVERLKQDGRMEAASHTQVYRPWGSYESIVCGPRFQAKRIIVNPGASLSLQLHHHRAEHWVVVKGCAEVTRGEDVFRLTEDESTYIPIGEKHRLANPGVIPVEIIEIQTGSYLGEDDIVRFEDAYGRQEKVDN